MKEHILIIEDEKAIQSVLYELLIEAGYLVTLADDGLEGLSQFRKQTFSLVLLDIMMPKIDGYAVCEIIRRTSDIPIIMLTAMDEEEAQVKAFGLYYQTIFPETGLNENRSCSQAYKGKVTKSYHIDFSWH